MEKRKLIDFLNGIPDDVRCRVVSDDDEDVVVQVWCGQVLRHGWTRDILRGKSIGEVMESFVYDNWVNVSYVDYGEIHRTINFDKTINEARGANTIEWDVYNRGKIEEYIDLSIPTNELKDSAKTIAKMLDLDIECLKNGTKSQYEEFIISHRKEFYAKMEKLTKNIGNPD